jgi:hypothetical protein
LEAASALTESAALYRGEDRQDEECHDRHLRLADQLSQLAAMLDQLPLDAAGGFLQPNTTYWFIDHGEIKQGVYTIACNDLFQVNFRTTCYAPNCRNTYHKSREAAEAALAATGV